MFGLFKRDPAKKLVKEIAAKRAASVQIQRSGDLRKYGALMTEISALEDQLSELRSTSSS